MWITTNKKLQTADVTLPSRVDAEGWGGGDVVAADLEAGLAGALGAVHGGVGGADQRLNRGAVARVERHADAGADAHAVFVHGVRIADDANELVAHQRGVL